jgi:hypothetical protein
MHQRPRDRDSLHLAARQLVRHARRETLHLHPAETLERCLTHPERSREHQGQFDVLGHGQRRQQVGTIEKRTQLFAAQTGESRVVQADVTTPSDLHFTGSGEVHCAREVEQGGFATTATAHQGDEFAALHVQRHVADGGHRFAIGDVILADVNETKNTHDADGPYLIVDAPPAGRVLFRVAAIAGNAAQLFDARSQGGHESTRRPLSMRRWPAGPLATDHR